MFYMTTFWILIALLFAFDFFIKKRIPESVSKHIIILLLSSSIGFLVVGIITRDPVFSFWGVPSELEWVVGVVLTVLTIWRYLFNPLQDRVMAAEKDIVSIKSRLTSVIEDLSLIKSKIMRL